MSSQNVLNEITTKVVQAARESLGEKLDKVILYGSYARGDFDDESDIDIMILADVPLEEQGYERKKIRKLLNRVDLEHDIVLSLCVINRGTFNRYVHDLPFFANVSKHGVEISG